MTLDFVRTTRSLTLFSSSDPFSNCRGILQQPLLLFCTDDTLFEIRRLRTAIWLPVSVFHGWTAACSPLLIIGIAETLITAEDIMATLDTDTDLV